MKHKLVDRCRDRWFLKETGRFSENRNTCFGGEKERRNEESGVP